MPPSILSLSHLIELNISYNQLKDDFAKLINVNNGDKEYFKHLKFLNLSHNQLTKVPHALYSLSRLENVSLNNNKLVAWSDKNVFLTWSEGNVGFRKCSLRKLDVSNNAQLGNPPVQLLRLSNINKLTLTGCAVNNADLLSNMDHNGVKEY